MKTSIGATAFLLFGLTLAHAQCLEDTRQVSLDSNNVVRLQNYLCSLDRGDRRINVEFHRFSDIAMGLIMTGSLSPLMRKTIGSPKLISNDVSRTYADLLQRFGSSNSAPTGIQTNTSLSVASPGRPLEMSSDDTIPGRQVRTFSNLLEKEASLSYPAAAELAALRRREMPSSLKYYYSILCQDGQLEPRPACQKFDSSDVAIQFWRGLTQSDINDYSRNLSAFNGLVRRDQRISNALPKPLSLARYLASGALPDDFLILIGRYGAGCGGSANDLDFSYDMRPVIVDTMTIENVSRQPVTVGTLFGGRSSSTLLRPGEPRAPSPRTKEALANLSETLQPGEKLMLLIRINFPVPEGLKNSFLYRETARDLQRRRGLGQYRGDAGAFGAPSPRHYVYGPEISVGGISIDGQRVELDKRAANYIELTVSALEGSCPFLQAWDGTASDWVEHGKALHYANGKAREYTETFRFDGFRSRFRLEEREPEIAFIDHVELQAILDSGEIITLPIDDRRLEARDNQYVELSWGQSIEFSFQLPPTLDSAKVVETRLSLTGFYERYSNLQRHESWRSWGGWTRASKRLVGLACVSRSPSSLAYSRPN